MQIFQTAKYIIKLYILLFLKQGYIESDFPLKKRPATVQH